MGSATCCVIIIIIILKYIIIYLKTSTHHHWHRFLQLGNRPVVPQEEEVCSEVWSPRHRRWNHYWAARRSEPIHSCLHSLCLTNTKRGKENNSDSSHMPIKIPNNCVRVQSCRGDIYQLQKHALLDCAASVPGPEHCLVTFHRWSG